jgi:hypothetical protein
MGNVFSVHKNPFHQKAGSILSNTFWEKAAEAIERANAANIVFILVFNLAFNFHIGIQNIVESPFFPS